MADDRDEIVEMYRKIGVLRQRAVEGDIDGVEALREVEEIVEQVASEEEIQRSL